MKSTSNHTRTPRIAVFAGSFNPFTIGHASIVERGLELFDKIIVAIGVNASKPSAGDASARAEAIARLYTEEPRIEVLVWNGLMVDLARQKGAHFFLRGVRSTTDFEYERNMADINRRIAGIETVVLYTLPEHAAISSSIVRELASYGTDITELLP